MDIPTFAQTSLAFWIHNRLDAVGRFGECHASNFLIPPRVKPRRIVADAEGPQDDFVAFDDDSALDEAVVEIVIGLRDIDDRVRAFLDVGSNVTARKSADAHGRPFAIR
jgi:hypothetical protein